MNAGEWVVVGLGAVVLGVAARGFWGGGLTRPSKDQVRRGGSNALLAMEEFVAPRIEHVITARQERNEDDTEAGDGPPPPLRFLQSRAE